MSLFDKKKILYPLVFLFFLILIFTIFQSLFSSYFEADEWFHFTRYLPLTAKPDGFLTASIYNIFHSEALSGGQHVTPIASSIFFLNVKFFGLQYEPYAFMALFFHAINSFLVFNLIKIYLLHKQKIKSFIFALMGGIFFALFPTAIHVWTGAAPFYGENILSLTFVLLFLITFKLAYLKKNQNYIYLSIFWILCALFSKETSGYVFLLFPLLVFLEKRIFSLKSLFTIFIIFVIFYTIIRFIVPNFSYIQAKLAHKFLNRPVPQSQQQLEKSVDTGTIVSRDLSIHNNLPGEVLFRTFTFPIKMTGTLFIPRQTTTTVLTLIAPVIYPIPQFDQATYSLTISGFVNGPGNGVIIYLVSTIIFISCIVLIIHFKKGRQEQEARAIAIGLAIIICSALPLVAIIFHFPRWGYDAYFDSRHYYHPSIGAAMLFPFLMYGTAGVISKLLHTKATSFVAIVLFIAWFIFNMNAMSVTFDQFVNRYSIERREVVKQFKTVMPHLSNKTVFHIETDGLSAYGPVLPFQTNIPQALSLIYYDTDPLPDSFFKENILDGKPEGYQYADGRGFGYYTSRKSLADALLEKEFSVDDVYSFYYEAEKVKLNDRTAITRDEMKKYIESRKEFSEWKTFVASPSASEKLTLLYPPDTEIIDYPIASTEAKILKDIQINNPQVTASLKIIRALPTIDVNETMVFFGKINDAELPTTKKVSFDEFHFNDAYVSNINNEAYYILKFEDLLISVITPNIEEPSVALLEKVLGSIKITK